MSKSQCLKGLGTKGREGKSGKERVGVALRCAAFLLSFTLDALRCDADADADVNCGDVIVPGFSCGCVFVDAVAALGIACSAVQRGVCR